MVQFLTGMFINLYVSFPGGLPEGSAWGWADAHSHLILFHVILGMLLVVISLISLVMSIVIRDRLRMMWMIFGVLFLAFAWFSGRNFLSDGQQDIYSYLMAMGFLGAAFFQVLALLRRTSNGRVK